MTTVTGIDIKNAAGDVAATGTVTISTDPRGSAGGTYIDGRAKKTPIVAGVMTSLNIEPGPVAVAVLVGSSYDHFEAVVPDEGPVDLADLKEQSYTYTPTVVSAAVAAKEAAEAAAATAQDLSTAQDAAVGDLVADSGSETRAALNATYAPATNIAKAALAGAVQTSLGKADTAAQPSDLTPKLDKTEAATTYAPVIDARVPAANLPAVFRTTDSQPFAADSIWNTPIGTGATFESSTAPATEDFLGATPVINDTLNGYGFYLNVARPTAPVGTGSYTSGGNTTTFTHRIPYDPVISSGSDGSMRVIDGRFVYDYWKTVKVDDYTYTADFITRTDLLGTGRNAGTRAARFPTSGGLIRSHELSKCYIPHALCISIPPEALKRGFVWPAAAEDAVEVAYSGEVPMGSFFAIPPSVDISTLGLSQEGYALAECLQNYGVYVGDASTSAAISVDGEAAVVMLPALERMRANWATIFAQLRRVTNVGTTAGGPGNRKVPATGPVAIRADYQETVIDVLTSRLRATSGGMVTSETCATPADPIVSTNAANGGSSLAWTGYPTQYRITGGAIKRIAAPDGSTRVLVLSPGKRNVRLECTVTAMHASGFFYLVAGSTGSSDGFRVAVTSGGALHIQKVVGGSGTALTAALPNGTVAVGKRLGIMVYGPNAYALIDGEVVAETVDSVNSAGNQCGIYFPSDTNIGVKDLTVRTVPRLFRKPV